MLALVVRIQPEGSIALPPSSDGAAETAASWIARLAEDLGVREMALDTQAAVLSVARDVAHGTERKYAPLAAFIAGRHVEARVNQGADPQVALGEFSAAVARLLEAPRAAP
jgi:hypothetical protein